MNLKPKQETLFCSWSSCLDSHLLKPRSNCCHCNRLHVFYCRPSSANQSQNSQNPFFRVPDRFLHGTAREVRVRATPFRLSSTLVNHGRIIGFEVAVTLPNAPTGASKRGGSVGLQALCKASIWFGWRFMGCAGKSEPALLCGRVCMQEPTAFRLFFTRTRAACVSLGKPALHAAHVSCLALCSSQEHQAEPTAGCIT